MVKVSFVAGKEAAPVLTSDGKRGGQHGQEFGRPPGIRAGVCRILAGSSILFKYRKHLIFKDGSKQLSTLFDFKMSA